MKEEYRSKTIEKALNILDYFREHKKLSLTDIKEKTKYNKSTLFRILSTLENNHYLEKDENRRYKLGIKLFILGNKFSKENQIRNVLHPYMEDIMEETKLTVQLSILEGLNVIVFDKVDPSKKIKMYSKIGITVPAHCTALGKTLLAYSSKRKVKKIIEYNGMKKYSSNTIVNIDELFEELKKIRTRGYAVDNSEHERHIECIGIPLLDDKENARAAISLTGLSMDFEEQEIIKNYSRRLQNIAKKASKQLGFK